VNLGEVVVQLKRIAMLLQIIADEEVSESDVKGTEI
jgi:hypothetical protein